MPLLKERGGRGGPGHFAVMQKAGPVWVLQHFQESPFPKNRAFFRQLVVRTGRSCRVWYCSVSCINAPALDGAIAMQLCAVGTRALDAALVHMPA